jgi:hypothetical protein
MTYEILENPITIREGFIKEYINTETFSPDAFMWEHLKTEAEEVSIDKAIRKLKKINTPVHFISEGEGNPTFNNCSLEEYEEDKKGFACLASTEWLTEVLEYEWFSKGAVMFDGFNLGSDDILPDDIYVFDNSYSWFVIFTQEWDGDDLDSRLCYIYNL